jgi:heme/copper-type cytochrome/quinol oxidase subunit 4
MRLKGLEERELIFILRVVRVRVVLLYFLHATRRVDPKAQPWFDETRFTV